ncbi:hypothetical protein ACFX2B_002323 [Malus domestica]
MAKDLAVKKLAIHSDSQLITSQTTREYMTKHPRMTQYIEKVCKQLKAFLTYTLTQVPQADNVHIDTLAGLGFALDHQLKDSIPVNGTFITESSIIDYLVNDTFPMERLESRKLQIKAARYYMWNDILVRRSYTGPHLHCLTPPR